ncbi:MAG: hypothetical protein V3V25_13365 [Paracoccaceae bacterium]
MKTAIIFTCALVCAPAFAQNFTTAAEVKPILQATKGKWIAVRLWQGQDLLYFTNLLSWRCGISEISYAVNGGPESVLQMEPCYEDTASPNSQKLEDFLPYIEFEADTISNISVSVTYDDGETDSEVYERTSVQIN